tara:strand:+ start:88 stop:687 length:600 start_codon:yes stop_codon:yes gene_type:complete
MALETGTYVNDLVITNPTGSDSISVGDDHIRLIKKVLKNTFPNATAARAALLGVGHNYRSGYTDISSETMTDSGLSITYTKLSGTSTLYVDVATEARLAASWVGEGNNTQTGFIRLVYATSTTTGISPSTSDNAAHVKENGMEVASGTMQLGWGVPYIWKITGLAAAAYTFKLQGKVSIASIGSIEFNDGTIRLMEVEE